MPRKEGIVSRRSKLALAKKVAVRDTLKASEYLRQIDEVSDHLRANWETIEPQQVTALKLLSDLQFRRLSKVLPDLKAVLIESSDKLSQHERLLEQLDERDIIDVN